MVMALFDSLRGHHSLQTASEVKSDLGDLSDLHIICDQSLPLLYIASSLNFPRRESDQDHHHLLPLRLKFRAHGLRCRYRAGLIN